MGGVGGAGGVGGVGGRPPVSNRPINTGNINTGNINTGNVNTGGGGGGGGGGGNGHHDHYYEDHHGDDWGYGSWHYGDDYPSPWAVGLAGVGLGWAMGSAGNYEYSNPYAAQGGDTNVYYNYSQPIVQPPATTPQQAGAAPAAAPPAAAVNPEATQAFEAARTAFAAGNYPEAQRQVETAIPLMPDDAVLHEFRALTLFAQGKYDEAAPALYGVLAAGPPWDWQTVQTLYGDVNVYTQQLRRLEQYVQGNPQSAPAHFVLAYQYMCIGDGDSAIVQLQEVTKLQPKDNLSASLLKTMQSGAGTGQPAASGAAPS